MLIFEQTQPDNQPDKATSTKFKNSKDNKNATTATGTITTTKCKTNSAASNQLNRKRENLVSAIKYKYGKKCVKHARAQHRGGALRIRTAAHGQK